MGMCYSGVDTLVISRPLARAPHKTSRIKIKRGGSIVPEGPWNPKRAGRFHYGDFSAFTCLQKDFECFHLVLGPNWRLDLRSFRFARAVNMSNRALFQGNKYWKPDKQLARLTSSWRVACVAKRFQSSYCAKVTAGGKKRKRSTNSQGNACYAD